MKTTSSPDGATERDPLRVLLVLDSLECGGAERHVVDLAKALCERGHLVTVAASAGGVLEEDLHRARIRVELLGKRTVKRRTSLVYARWLRWLVRRLDADVVHGHMYASEVASAVATTGTATALVLTDHTEGPWRGRVACAFSARAYQRADGLIAVSSAISTLLRERYAVEPERIQTVLPVPVACPASTGAAGERSGRLLVGRVCRLVREKGVDVFLQAAALTRARHPEAHFVVVGDGPIRDDLERLVRELGLTDNVSLLGYRDDARELIAQLDVLVVSSYTDGSPLVVLEAMAAGVPVVATAVGGLPDQLRDGLEGLLVEHSDPVALAHAVSSLLSDPQRRKRLALAGMRRASALTHAAMVDQVEHVYRRALAAPAAVGAARMARGAGWISPTLDAAPEYSD